MTFSTGKDALEGFKANLLRISGRSKYSKAGNKPWPKACDCQWTLCAGHGHVYSAENLVMFISGNTPTESSLAKQDESNSADTSSWFHDKVQDPGSLCYWKWRTFQKANCRNQWYWCSADSYFAFLLSRCKSWFQVLGTVRYACICCQYPIPQTRSTRVDKIDAWWTAGKC